uniref:Uncharacterized protein n=1 Tax=Fagus sylvatica TaxID=28930 RepID=A0A2N9HNB9_FAGSY
MAEKTEGDVTRWSRERRCGCLECLEDPLEELGSGMEDSVVVDA